MRQKVSQLIFDLFLWTPFFLLLQDKLLHALPHICTVMFSMRDVILYLKWMSTESLQSDCGKTNRIYSPNMNAYVFECHPLVEITYTSNDDVAITTCIKSSTSLFFSISLPFPTKNNPNTGKKEKILSHQKLTLMIKRKDKTEKFAHSKFRVNSKVFRLLLVELVDNCITWTCSLGMCICLSVNEDLTLKSNINFFSSVLKQINGF